MDSTVCYLLVLCTSASIIVGRATNGTSDTPLLASPSFTFRPQTSILPSETQLTSFHPTRSAPVFSSMSSVNPPSTSSMSPTPAPWLSESSPLSEVLHTPTPSPSLLGSQESPLAPPTSQSINASEFVRWQSSSAPFPLPPIPPPFSVVSSAGDGLLVSMATLTTSAGQGFTQLMPEAASSADAWFLSSVYQTVFLTSTVYETASVPMESQADSYVLQATPSGPSFTTPSSVIMATSSLGTMATSSLDFTMTPSSGMAMTPSLSMSSPKPTPSASVPLLSTSSALPTPGPQDNSTFPTSRSTQSTVPSTLLTTVRAKTVSPNLTPVKCTMTLAGDCSRAKKQQQLFAEAFATFVADILEMHIKRLSVQGIRCGSVIVDFIIQDSEEEALAEDLTIMVGEGHFGFQFDNQNFTATEAVVSPARPTRKPLGGLTFEEQQRLIYIVISSAVGVVLLLALILLIHHRVRKSCTEHTQSFDVQDEPHIKLSNFNMAHTYIPRPRSIYSSRLGADGLYHHNNGSLHRGGMQSPTPYVYADDEAIREHYHEVVDREPASPTTRTSQDFGRSGVPKLNLPRLEGVYRAGQDEDTVLDDQLLRPLATRRGSTSSTDTRLSATFHAPPESTSGAPPESTPGALPESTPGAPPESTPGALPESTPGAPPESPPECPPTPPPPPPPPPPPSPPPSPGLDPPTLDLPPPPPLPPPTPKSFHQGTPLSARMSQVSNGSSSEATNSVHGDTSFLLYKGCDYDPQPQGIDNPVYDRCADEGAGQGVRAPSFYRMTPPPSV